MTKEEIKKLIDEEVLSRYDEPGSKNRLVLGWREANGFYLGAMWFAEKILPTLIEDASNSKR